MPQITQIIDDKSEHCIPFILERIQASQEQHKRAGEDPPPFFIGLNGVQGAGKTTLVGQLFYMVHSQSRDNMHFSSDCVAFVIGKALCKTSVYLTELVGRNALFIAHVRAIQPANRRFIH